MQRRRRGFGQTKRLFSVAPPLGAQVCPPAFDSEWSGRSKPFERSAPESLRLVLILLPQPSDIISEGARLFQAQRPPLAVCVVKSEDLFQKNRKRPAVHQQVMVAQDENVLLARSPEQSQVHERRAPQVKPLLTIPPQVLFQ